MQRAMGESMLDEPVEHQDPKAKWNAYLMTRETASGGVIRLTNAENIRVILEYHPTFEHCIRLNEFTDTLDIVRPIRLHDGIVIPVGEYHDDHGVLIQTYFNRVHWMTPSVQTVEATMRAVARKCSYHPVRDYLLSLPSWDGVNRVSQFFYRYCGGWDTPANELIAGFWLLSAVARVLPPVVTGRWERHDQTGPGCYVKYCAVMEGRQSLYKSGLFRALCPCDEWYGDNDLDLENEKQVGEQLKGKWLYEIPEFDKVMRYHPGQLKSALSRRSDRFRAAFARGNSRDHLRHNVFVGTTNESEYLRDSTGNSRVWPVACGVRPELAKTYQIDVEAIERDRDQIWAQIVGCFASGMNWWPTASEELEILGPLQADRLEELPLQRQLERWLDQPNFGGDESWKDFDVIPTDVVIRCGLKVTEPNHINIMKAQVEACLKRLGWAKGKHWVKSEGKTLRGWKRLE